jgi:YebC/PmpR family DNA-binding regulatory protein
MGAQWKHAGRTANAAKRGALISKLVKEIIVAAKSGDPNPDNNARLWAAVQAAKKGSVPRDNIDRALKKGAGLLDDGLSYESVFYEGFAPHRVPVIVECLTDNKNRTASDVRVIFRKGQLGSIGSVGWMFDRRGVVEATHADASLDREGVAIEAGAQDVEELDPASVEVTGGIGARFLCDPKDLDAVSKFVTANGWTIHQSELSFLAKSFVDLGESERKEVVDFLGELDDHDDVHRVYAGIK